MAESHVNSPTPGSFESLADTVDIHNGAPETITTANACSSAPVEVYRESLPDRPLAVVAPATTLATSVADLDLNVRSTSLHSELVSVDAGSMSNQALAPSTALPGLFFRHRHTHILSLSTIWVSRSGR